MTVSNTTGTRITYSDISEARLCEIVSEVLQVIRTWRPETSGNIWSLLWLSQNVYSLC